MSKSELKRLAIQKGIISTCCKKPVNIHGNPDRRGDTIYYTCSQCDKGCDAEEAK